MYELRELTERCYYIDCPARMGLVHLDDGNVLAIDSGSDKDAGKKLLRHVRAQGWQLSMVCNTHSHADHTGGNRYLQEQTGCRILCAGLESAIVNHPLLEPAMLYGALPMKELQNKFLMAQPSSAEPLTPEKLPEGITMLPLPGHSPDMTGFRTADDVVYLGDCLSARETLDKYGISYLWDVEAFLRSLEEVQRMEARIFVPAHAAPTEDIVPLARYNMEAVLNTGERILSFCSEPAGFEELLQRLFASYGLSLNLQQYALLGSTLRSYLTWLYGKGELTYFFEEGRMLWRKN